MSHKGNGKRRKTRKEKEKEKEKEEGNEKEESCFNDIRGIDALDSVYTLLFCRMRYLLRLFSVTRTRLVTYNCCKII